MTGVGSPANPALLKEQTRPVPTVGDKQVLVQVAAAALNPIDYKLRMGYIKAWPQAFPIVPGIDFAGVVAHSRSPRFSEGDVVALTGNKAGQYFDGGYAQRASCQAEHLVRLPSGMSPLQARETSC